MLTVVIGCGRVGYAYLAWLVENGHKAAGRDTSPAVQEHLRRDGFRVVENLDDIDEPWAAHLCLPTEGRADGSANLDELCRVVDALAALESSGSALTFVSQRSTCPPGTADELSMHFQNTRYGVNPSFIRMENIAGDTGAPERLAIGGDPLFARHILSMSPSLRPRVFYSQSRRIVELLKYVENNVDAMLISFWNELFDYAESIGISGRDFGYLLDHLGDRPRFASVARVPGGAFGGWCLPKDVAALARSMQDSGAPSRILEAVIAANAEVRSKRGVNKVGGWRLMRWMPGRGGKASSLAKRLLIEILAKPTPQ